MTKRMLIDATHDSETRVAILDEDTIDHFDFVSAAKRQLKGNIYLGKITRVEPSLQAAFVEYGGGKQGFLSFSEIHPDYYQIPVADRKRLMEEAAAAAEEAEREEEAAIAAEEARENAPAPAERAERRPRRRSTKTQEAVAAENEPTPDDGVIELADAVETPADALEQGPEATAEAESAAEKTQEASGEAPEGEPGEEDGPRRRGRRRPFASRSKSARSAPSRDLEVSSETVDDEEHEERGSIETVSEEDAESAARKPRQSFSRRYKIQEVIKPNQIVLVQVVKEERGNKGCSLSTFISLPGRYCVLMPNSPKDGGISRKIGSNADRKRLKDIATELRESRGMSAIIRTAGIDRTKTEIKRDYEYLIKLWGTTRDLALSSTAPALVYEEGNLVKRTIRDYYNGDIDEILVQGEEAFKSAKDFMKMIMPSHAARVKLFKEAQPLFSAYGVEEQLAELYHPVAPLPSGGYLVINPTEALISVDVNSGRSTTERNVEETAFKTNLEAADEVARQLRLRDLGGLVVIDFIDMGYGKHRRAVEKAVKDALKSDRAKVQVGHISPFGLMELSRQRLGPSIFEATTHACPHCKGTGNLRSAEATAMAVIRELGTEAFETGAGEYRLRLNARDALVIMNQYREQIVAIENEHGIHVLFEIDPELQEGVFTLDNGKGGGSHHRRNQDTRPTRRRRGGRNRSGRTDRPGERGSAERGPATSRPLLATDEEESPIVEDEREEETAEESAAREERNGEEGSEREGRRRRSRRGRRGGQRARGPRDGEGSSEGAREPSNAGMDEYPAEGEGSSPEAAAEPSAEDDAGEAPRRSRSRGGRGRSRSRETSEESGDVSPATEIAPASLRRSESTRAEPRQAEPRQAEPRQEAPSHPATETSQPVLATHAGFAPAATNLHAPIQKDSDQPKRKGWWSKITG